MLLNRLRQSFFFLPTQISKNDVISARGRGQSPPDFEREDVKIENGREKAWKWTEDFFFFFPFSLFETTEICFGLPKWTIFTRKKHTSHREKIVKIFHLWKIFLLHPWPLVIVFSTLPYTVTDAVSVLKTTHTHKFIF